MEAHLNACMRPPMKTLTCVSNSAKQNRMDFQTEIHGANKILNSGKFSGLIPSSFFERNESKG